MSKEIGTLANAWKGMKASYFAKHSWLNKHYSGEFVCANNKEHSGIIEFANISGEYLREFSDYVLLCRPCHRKFDLKQFCKRGHKYTEENTCIRKNGARHCRKCQNIYAKNNRVKKPQ